MLSSLHSLLFTPYSSTLSLSRSILDTMSLQPIKIWGHWGAPNPWKVCTILEALGLPYKISYLELNEVKNEAYVKITPNGRLPTIEDPNTGVTLWEVRFTTKICPCRAGELTKRPAVWSHHPIPDRSVR